MTFDYKKPFTTADGRKARLLADDLNNSHQLVVAVDRGGAGEHVRIYRKDGTTYSLCAAGVEDTLVNIPEREEFFINVYVAGMIERYSSRQNAKDEQVYGAIGVMRVVMAGKNVVEQEYFPNADK